MLATRPSFFSFKVFSITLSGLFYLSSFTQAGFHFGLGHAVAKNGTKVFDKAEVKVKQREFVENVDPTLPSCGEVSPYSVSPISIADIQGIDPLGHVNPSGHTFPSDHIYFYIRPIDSNSPSGTRITSQLFSPGKIHITSISSSYTNGNISTIDYGIVFYPCRELRSYYSHVKTLDTPILTALNSSPQSCQDYTTGGSSYHRCDATTDITLSAGELMGTVGGNAAAFDFGSYDQRRTPIAFISPSRHYSTQKYTVCPLDYFESSLKTTLESHLGRWDGAVQRTEAPLCGSILHDISGTAAGDWYKIGSPDSPEDPHLALIHDNVYTQREDISIGTSVPGISPIFYPFDPITTGTHNRDFSQVTADGNVYCYDSFYDPIGQHAFTGFSILITMPTSTTIRVEKLSSASCGSGPWTMGSSYAEFQR